DSSASLSMWNTATGERLFGPLKVGERDATEASLSPDGKTLAAIGVHAVQVFDAESGRALGVPVVSRTSFNTVAYDPASDRVIASSEDNTATIFDARTGVPLAEPLEHLVSIRDACFSPDGTQVMTWSYDQRGRVWDARTGQPVMQFMNH